VAGDAEGELRYFVTGNYMASKVVFFLLLALIYLGPLVGTLACRWCVRGWRGQESNSEVSAELQMGFWLNFAAACGPVTVVGLYCLPPKFLSGLVFVPLFLLLAAFLMAPFGGVLVLWHGRGWIRPVSVVSSLITMAAAVLTLFGGMASA
jgi:hypothetical protein